MISKLLKMQLLEDDDELAYAPSDEQDTVHKEVDGRPSWMRILCTDLQEWSKMLPKVLKKDCKSFW
jgi:dynein heavy chain 1